MNASTYVPRQSLLTFLSRSSAPKTSLSQCRSRPFSSSRHHAAKMGTQTLKPRVPAQMSMKNRVKETMSGANREMIPDDVGLLPGTFIKPTWQNMPSILKDPKQRLRMEWISIKTRFMNLIRYVTCGLMRMASSGRSRRLISPW